MRQAWRAVSAPASRCASDATESAYNQALGLQNAAGETWDEAMDASYRVWQSGKDKSSQSWDAAKEAAWKGWSATVNFPQTAATAVKARNFTGRMFTFSCKININELFHIILKSIRFVCRALPILDTMLLPLLLTLPQELFLGQ